ncbi:MAG: sigma-70 family RNA polymerase sigma factor [bacterium]|jgi:RNA polymerase sigma-70 factor (ECF subfamily)|nr:sigma-70 family RNA polymerase sigma factor [bacterium]
MNSPTLADLNDRDLVVKLQTQPDLETFDELLKRYHKPIFYFCLRTLNDLHRAEEVTQDVMYKVYRKISRLKNPERIKTWMYRIASNTCKDLFRASWREEVVEPEKLSRLPDRRLDPGQLAELKERSERVREAVAALPPMQRQAIILYHFHHLSYRDIAEIMQCPLGTIMSRICYGKRQLKSVLSEYFEPEPNSAGKGGVRYYVV